MGTIFSSAKSDAEREANVFLSQQVGETCDINCNQLYGDINLDLVNVKLGGDIDFTQTCSVNGSCSSDAYVDSVADVLFKGANSTAAKGGLFGLVKTANTKDRTSIKTTINNQTNQQCNVSSYQAMSDINIFALNSEIDGNVAFSQQSSVEGQCKMGTEMSAAATATGLINDYAGTGKGSNKAAKRLGKPGKSKKGGVFYYIIIIVVVLIVVTIFAKMFTSGRTKKQQQAQAQKIAAARAVAGCPGGTQPVKDSQGKIIIDPRSGKPICPPPPLYPQPSAPASTTSSSLPASQVLPKTPSAPQALPSVPTGQSVSPIPSAPAKQVSLRFE